MAFGWINPNDYSFNSFLLLERFQIFLMFSSYGWSNDENKSIWKYRMGVALNANPAVKWYFQQRCPECFDIIEEISSTTPSPIDEAEIRESEIYVLLSVEDFTIYTTPEFMGSNCDFIRGWNSERLYDLVDLTDKTVLDVGSGSGRLAFAAAKKASWVYASEPVGTLREFMRDKINLEKIINVRVMDGFITALPFPDNTFDVVMCGHVIGDDYDSEIKELTRVCKPGGYLINCPGDSERDMKPNTELTSRGWEEFHYLGSFSKEVYTHRKLITKI